MKWSYKTVHFELKKEGLLGGAFLDETEIEEQLNDFGRSGWDLVSVIEVHDGIIAFFKQPLDLKTSATSPLGVIEDSAQWEYEEPGEREHFVPDDSYVEDREGYRDEKVDPLAVEPVEDLDSSGVETEREVFGQYRQDPDFAHYQEEQEFEHYQEEQRSEQYQEEQELEQHEEEQEFEQYQEEQEFEQYVEEPEFEEHEQDQEAQEEEPEDLDDQSYKKGIGAIRIE